MQTTVTFKKIDPSSSLKSYVQKKLEKFDRLLESPAEAHVVLSVEKIRHIAEITLTCDKLKIHAKEDSEVMYASIDALMDKVKSQINKHKEKIKKHMSGNKHSIKNDADALVSEEDVPETSASDQIIIETIDYKPMDVEDAAVELNSGKQSFFVFNNARTEQLNVLYKHNNGKLGLIQPRG
ncbi:MAG: ribosome-associated translation inhibitor RaiA [Proteobacteria bacterium]|nr:ribosome-associated translation inhibitor RaiA [Pseudomonadota bacterium]MBU1386985.1 ribosome-associated translation inhibitor RaiA [Pseudomonadota bacterium]MBU1542334.1 ribosome-associated translation inhibitor RaiA [Pseudomonadota bacterium]MBU2431460.1 ribosome-associated translation inhibitor RaiA [Pseudomonadota bacterium]MBU2481797.1 ribosome-associated translation inhibitor RaiA [Pseudomonadota bacterium]